jgi:uncharacterized integral membrane protein (TIGR00698 family)
MTIVAAPVRPARRFAPIEELMPGLALTGGIAALAFAMRLVPGASALSPMILAVLLGVFVNNAWGAPAATRAGVAFALRRILRLAIVLLGAQITLAQAAEIGGGGIAAIAITLVSTLAFTMLMGRALGVPRGLALLIGVGTSICGASAVIAAKSATGGDDEDAAYAVACVTIFGTIAMFAHPFAGEFMHLTPRAYGLWVGASIHEIAQAVAAAFQGGREAGDLGTIAKLTRVAMMAPVVIALGEIGARLGWLGGAARARPPFPWFLLGFLGLALLNSLVGAPREIIAPVSFLTTALLSMAMAAMGLHADLRRLRARGVRPLALGLAASLFISLLGLLLLRTLA